MRSSITISTRFIAIISVAIAFAFGINTYAKPAKAKAEPTAAAIGAGCAIFVAPLSHNSPGTGDTFNVLVSVAGQGCIYGVFSSPLWISTSGVPTSTLTVTVEPNLGQLRTGTFIVRAMQNIGGGVYVETSAQSVFTVTQPQGSCPYTFDRTVDNIGGNTTLYGFINVTTSASCPRNATSNASWLEILSGSGFFGSGPIEYSVARNYGPARTGKITLGNASYTVNQGSGCTYDFSPTSKTFDAAGGTGSINVTASNSACPRNVTSSVNWISIIGGNNSAGNGPVTYSVSSNNGPTRTGELKINGATLTVTQTGGCSYTLSPSIFNFQSGNGSSSIQVTASSSQCVWSPASNANWVKITSAAQVTGSGTVTFTVDPNQGTTTRTTTIDVGNKSATINQFGNPSGGDCSFSISPGGYQFGAAGGEVSVNLTASKASCNWSIVNLPAFISVVNGGLSSTGSAVVNLKALTNPGPVRAASVQIAGKTFAITQDANPQALTIIDLSPGFTAAGGESFILVVKGTNFSNASKVRWNGDERQTTFYNNSTLGAVITAGDISDEGAFDVMVVNSGSGIQSNTREFMVYGAIANVSSASYKGESLAPNSMVTAFGVDLSKELKIAASQPLPTELAGTTVSIKDAIGKEYQSQIFFVSPGQVNYLMPGQVVLGKATVTITSGSGHTSVSTMEMTSVAPGIFSANSTGSGLAAALVLRVKANGQQVYEQTVEYDSGKGAFNPKPINLSVPGEEVYLVLYGTGVRYRSSLASVMLNLGGVPASALYAGEAPGYAGLDQINALLPISLAGRGEVDLTMMVDGKQSNTVRLAFK